MIAIRNMGFNSVHKDGINIERPEGGMRYLLLLVKSPAYFEFTKEQFQKMDAWMQKNARPYDRAKWNHLFHGGSKDSIVEEMLKYRYPSVTTDSGYESEEG